LTSTIEAMVMPRKTSSETSRCFWSANRDSPMGGGRSCGDLYRHTKTPPQREEGQGRRRGSRGIRFPLSPHAAGGLLDIPPTIEEWRGVRYGFECRASQ